MRSVDRRGFQDYDSLARKHRKQRYVIFFCKDRFQMVLFSYLFRDGILSVHFWGSETSNWMSIAIIKNAETKGVFKHHFFSQKSQKSSFFGILQSYFEGREFCGTPDQKCKIGCSKKYIFNLLVRKRIPNLQKTRFYEFPRRERGGERKLAHRENLNPRCDFGF